MSLCVWIYIFNIKYTRRARIMFTPGARASERALTFVRCACFGQAPHAQTERDRKPPHVCVCASLVSGDGLKRWMLALLTLRFTLREQQLSPWNKLNLHGRAQATTLFQVRALFPLSAQFPTRLTLFRRNLWDEAINQQTRREAKENASIFSPCAKIKDRKNQRLPSSFPVSFIDFRSFLLFAQIS